MPLATPPWIQSSDHPVLYTDEVHVWRISLDQPTADYAALLSNDEQTRAKCFRFEQGQRRFTVGRGSLRIILGRYLNLPPEKLQFDYGSHGKPVLTAQPIQNELTFNLSHSEEVAICAVTQNSEVGIDIEKIRPIPDVEKLAEQFFSPLERAELDAMPPGEKLDSFLRGWTRKEAYLKARGDGMTYPLDQFSVSMDYEQPARLLEVKDDPQELLRWSFHTFTPAPGYLGALAVAGQNLKLSQWQLMYD